MESVAEQADLLQNIRRVDLLTKLFKIQHVLVELDTDVVGPGNKRTRDRHRLYLSADNVFLFPVVYPRIEPPFVRGH